MELFFTQLLEFYPNLEFSNSDGDILVDALVTLLQHGDIELNPGPKYFSICHWKLSSLTAHNYLKVSQLQALNLVHKFDIICIWETHLDSSISKDDNALSIEGYSMIRADHPSNTKRGGVCIYYSEKISATQMNSIII